MTFQENCIPVATVLAVSHFVVNDSFKVDSEGGLKISVIGRKLKELLAESAIVEHDVPAVAMARLMPDLPAEKLTVAWAQVYNFLLEAAPGSYSFHVLDGEGVVRVLCAQGKGTHWDLEIQDLRYSASHAHVAFSLENPFVIISHVRPSSAAGEGIAA